MPSHHKIFLGEVVVEKVHGMFCPRPEEGGLHFVPCLAKVTGRGAAFSVPKCSFYEEVVEARLGRGRVFFQEGNNERRKN